MYLRWWNSGQEKIENQEKEASIARKGYCEWNQQPKEIKKAIPFQR